MSVASKQSLYAYVDGSDLVDLADDMTNDLQAFVASRSWRTQPTVVNQRRIDDARLEPGDLPPWELGLNLDLPAPGAEPSEWFDDVASIARYLGELHDKYGRDFVLGIHFADTNATEDVFFVESADVDTEELRRALG
jgi:hypothetical protein